MDDLLTELVGAGVSVVIDVRETPWSYVPAYRAATLRVVLAERGIRYLHAQFAGNPKWIRQSARSHEECLAMYRAHLNAHPQIAERLRALQVDTENIAGIIAANTNRSEPQVLQDMLDRIALNPEEALAYGLVHEIIEEVFPAGAELISIQSGSNA